ncbi:MULTISPECIES: SgrR family transcriptional regulator [unclassified Burkholderia]|uniref:SgrR family transcriptional regulator n=1 Tax=unclassified Burkholderia TaxID=2613784 RepID=UPI00141F1D6C|nr:MULTISPECIES: SgrR family transcriptional regulator [unclassified Burkholderia]NIE55511.1 SgrR family transcriptional regulator [Burkholderia sp. Ap-955]NIF08741.1 SgrR family transcriptional regulator [Burkholderia sp. Ax-1735]NIG02311.1 SgrR family transcriptional regulator [Burkholderia sp. Tr-849]
MKFTKTMHAGIGWVNLNRFVLFAWTFCITASTIKTANSEIFVSSFMRLIDQFHRLGEFLDEHGSQPGLPALARALNCTERNARGLLRKMEAQGWLRWEAARGRGHFSRLTMLVAPQHAVLDRLSCLLADGELEQAFASLGDDQRQQLLRRLPDFLGIHPAGSHGHRLRIPLYRAVDELDPYRVISRLEAHLVRQIFSRLTEFDRRTQRVVPALAHHWEPEEAGRVWHFWLRPNVSFHDGRLLEPEDVRCTLLRMRDEPSYFQRLYRHLLDVEIGEGRRIICRLGDVDHLWPQRLAAANASIVPRRRNGDFARMPIGTGPFKLTRHSDYRITLSAFGDHYRERALLDELDLWFLPSTEQADGFDLRFGYSASHAPENKGIVRVQAGCTYVVCNATREAFRERADRLALADWLAPATLFGHDDPARRPAAGLLPAWRHRVATPAAEPFVPKCTALTLVTGQTHDERVLARAIEARLHDAGIRLRVLALPYAELIRRDWLDSADLVLGSEILHDDEDFGCYEWFGADSVFRQWMPEHAARELDHRLHAVQAQADPRARMADYEAIGKELVDAAWLIPISHEHQHVELESHVAGVEAAPLGFVSFAELWVR